jgi:hypothetical protein
MFVELEAETECLVRPSEKLKVEGYRRGKGKREREVRYRHRRKQK